MQSSFVEYACTRSILLEVENWFVGLNSTEMKSTNVLIGEGTIVNLNPRAFPC